MQSKLVMVVFQDFGQFLFKKYLIHKLKRLYHSE